MKKSSAKLGYIHLSLNELTETIMTQATNADVLLYLKGLIAPHQRYRKSRIYPKHFIYRFETSTLWSWEIVLWEVPQDRVPWETRFISFIILFFFVITVICRATFHKAFWFVHNTLNPSVMKWIMKGEVRTSTHWPLGDVVMIIKV